MEYLINLETFQGPFDLLMYLIEQKEVDIYNIPISEITEQYLEYLDEMKNLNLNVTSEFILMAATLIEIKSQMLLPRKEKDEEDPRMILVNQLLEYKMCKQASEKLKECEYESSFFVAKPKEEIEFEEKKQYEQFAISEVNAYELYNIFIKLLKERNIKIETEPVVPAKIYRESFSVKRCSDDILAKLKKNSRVSVFGIFNDFSGDVGLKEYVISVFLAILELSKDKHIKIYQKDNFTDIELVYAEKIDEGEEEEPYVIEETEY